MSAGTLSAAGEALHRLPPGLARLWICVEPMSSTASTTPGHAALSAACSPISAPVAAAPTRNAPPSEVIRHISAMFFTSTIRPGRTVPACIWTSRSVPPASTRPPPFAAASSATASSTERGASYRMAFMVSLHAGTAARTRPVAPAIIQGSAARGKISAPLAPRAPAG